MGAPASFPTRSVWEIPLSPLPTVFPRMTATMTEATAIRPAMHGPACSHDCSAANPRPKTTKLLTGMLPTIHSTVPPASMVPPPKPRWSIRSTGEIIGARTIASSSYDGRPHGHPALRLLPMQMMATLPEPASSPVARPSPCPVGERITTTRGHPVPQAGTVALAGSRCDGAAVSRRCRGCGSRDRSLRGCRCGRQRSRPGRSPIRAASRMPPPATIQTTTPIGRISCPT